MSTAAQPRKPVEDWEQVRDEWVSAFEGLVCEVETWSAEQGWAMSRETKTIEEDRLGSYQVARLLIHASFGRMVLDPIARYVAGARGLAELAELPSYDSFLVARHLDSDGWFVQSTDSAASRREWDKASFLATVKSFRIAS